MVERQELWCHECGKYVQFNIDVTLNGNHVIKCPSCGHEHCRVVIDGKITEERWDSRNGNNNGNILQTYGTTVLHTYMATGLTNSTTSTYATYTQSGVTNGDACSAIMYASWMDSGTGNSGYI